MDFKDKIIDNLEVSAKIIWGAGFFIGLIVSGSMSFGITLIIWIQSFVSGIIMIGFSEIISSLKDNTYLMRNQKNNDKEIIESLKKQLEVNEKLLSKLEGNTNRVEIIETEENSKPLNKLSYDKQATKNSNKSTEVLYKVRCNTAYKYEGQLTVGKVYEVEDVYEDNGRKFYSIINDEFKISNYPYYQFSKV